LDSFPFFYVFLQVMVLVFDFSVFRGLLGYDFYPCTAIERKKRKRSSPKPASSLEAWVRILKERSSAADFFSHDRKCLKMNKRKLVNILYIATKGLSHRAGFSSTLYWQEWGLT
jgi:hypothetical protein